MAMLTQLLAVMLMLGRSASLLIMAMLTQTQSLLLDHQEGSPRRQENQVLLHDLLCWTQLLLMYCTGVQ